jgi:hypothetical protein
MRAKEWYMHFRKYFTPKESDVVKRIYPNDTEAEFQAAEWTKMMREFLSEMAEKLEYNVVPEFSSFSQKRFDMKWERDHDEIYIEYENNREAVLGEEVPKLFSVSGKLRVLITYMPLEEIARGCLAKSVLKELKKKKGGENFEFLLVLGTEMMYDFTDWVGYEFFPTYNYRVLRRKK